ncbi:MAG: sugar phosphate isomerase/epimerase [Saprospiraceae bacterium]|nr:sugar phosphate isomerase/epimerase [Saprospiraceae bacterium]
MYRRDFIRSSISSAILLQFPIVRTSHLKKKDRIGITSVVFRNRFASTCPRNMELKDELTLNSIPEYFVDRFDIHNVELWARHFESKDPNYLRDLKAQLNKHHCKLIDIQAEGVHDLSDTDQESREKAIKETMEWIDVCSLLQSEFIRIRSMKKSYDIARESLRKINSYAKSKGIKVLIENHFDLFSDPKKHAQIYKDIDGIGLLADFGNYPKGTDRLAALLEIAPYTKLVSAKTQDFDAFGKHLSYDFGQCIDLFERSNYQGIYSIEQWGKPDPQYDYEAIVDHMIDQIVDHI